MTPLDKIAVFVALATVSNMHDERGWSSFVQCFLRINFLESPLDHSLFARSTRYGRVLLLYVDDMTIICDEARDIQFVKHHLQQQFRMKDLGPYGTFLVLRFSRVSMRFSSLHSNILDRAAIIDDKTVDTSLQPNVKLLSRDGELLLEPTHDKLGQSLFTCVSRDQKSLMPLPVLANLLMLHDQITMLLFYICCGTLWLFCVTSRLHSQAYFGAVFIGDHITMKVTTEPPAGYCIFLGSNFIISHGRSRIMMLSLLLAPRQSIAHVHDHGDCHIFGASYTTLGFILSLLLYYFVTTFVP